MEVKMQNKLSLIPKGKKGNAGNELLGWIILFGLIGLIGAIFGLIQSEVETDVIDEMTDVVSTTQNALNVTNAGVSLTECSAVGGKITSLSAINWTSGGGTITSGNYTYNYGCTLTPTGSIYFNNTKWNITYSFNYTESSFAYNNSQKAQEAQGKIFGKLPLVGTIVVLTLILMLVLGVVSYFQNRNQGTGQVS
jgi:hypothetical protein